MTSQLRRKRPITRPNTRPPATKRSPLTVPWPTGWPSRTLSLALALTIGTLVALPRGPALAEDSGVQRADFVAAAEAEDEGVQAVSYSTGEAGNQLTWLPYRPSESRDKTPPGRLTQYTTPNSNGPLPPGGIDPFDAPFGDTNSASQIAPGGNGAKALQDNTLEKALPGWPDGNTLPSLPGEKVPLSAESSEESEQYIGRGELEAGIAAGPNVVQAECPAESDLKGISQIIYDIRPPGKKFPNTCAISSEAFEPRSWEPMTFTWKASGLSHKPLYFEDVQLERYGHSWGPFLQPVISGGHFFLTVPILPYKMGLNPPQEDMYTLGYYRPGNCAPYMLDPLPISARAALAQAGAVVGLAYLIP